METNIDTEKELADLPFIYRLLGRIETVGNKLPHPATLFVIFAVLVLILSAISAYTHTMERLSSIRAQARKLPPSAF